MPNHQHPKKNFDESTASEGVQIGKMLLVLWVISGFYYELFLPNFPHTITSKNSLPGSLPQIRSTPLLSTLHRPTALDRSRSTDMHRMNLFVVI